VLLQGAALYRMHYIASHLQYAGAVQLALFDPPEERNEAMRKLKAADAVMEHLHEYLDSLVPPRPPEALPKQTYTGGSFTVNLSAMSGTRTLAVEWFNPSTGVTIAGTPIASGSPSQSFTPPFSGDAVLYLMDAAGHATVSGR
jgi:hypothetical protein